MAILITNNFIKKTAAFLTFQIFTCNTDYEHLGIILRRDIRTPQAQEYSVAPSNRWCTREMTKR